MKKNIVSQFVSILMVIVFLCTNMITCFAYDSSYEIDLSECCPYDTWAADAAKSNRIIFLEDIRRNVKRWEIASILSFIVDDSTEETIGFIDINELESKYRTRIEKVSKAGIVLGYDDSTFKPFSDVTRAEFVTMLSRTKILDNSNKNINISFSDISNHWAKQEILKIAGIGIVNGKGNNKFCPNDYITVQEIFIILDRIKDEIGNNVFFKCLQETFSCRKYTDEEAYLVETMYFNYNEVQNVMNLYWHYNNRYDTSKWNGYATYKDLAYSYHSLFGNMKKDEEFIELYMLKDEIDLKESFDKPVNFKHLIYVFGTSYDYMDYSQNLNFKNKDSFSDFELNKIRSATCYNKVIDNSNYYLPWDNCKVTRYMLTVLLYNSMVKGNSFGKLWDQRNYPYDFKLSTNNLPSNYREYPYIITTVPKWIYEKEFVKNSKFYTPKECYNTYASYYDEMSYCTKRFFDLTLNVDYTTMNVEEFVQDVYDCAYATVGMDEIRKYAQYVIDNKIILKGSGYLVPGTIYISDIFLYGRVVVEFEIISADKRINLLLADEMNYENIYYKSNKYNLCFDNSLIPIYNYETGGISIFNVNVLPIARFIYGYKQNITEF